MRLQLEICSYIYSNRAVNTSHITITILVDFSDVELVLMVIATLIPIDSACYDFLRLNV